LFVAHALSEIQGAKAVGMNTVMFVTGDDTQALQPNAQAQADAVIFNFQQLVDIVALSQHFVANSTQYTTRHTE
jgi:phosphoglycolate phosphatase-like HAD superfamily hydrolase